MKKQVKWTGDAALANKLFGDNYGVDWVYEDNETKTGSIVVANIIYEVGDTIELSPAEMQRCRDDFAALVNPVIKWLNDNHNPHAIVIITPTTAELVYGEMTHVTEEFVKD